MKTAIYLKVTKKLILTIMLATGIYSHGATLDEMMEQAGMVDVKSVIPNIRVELLYATTGNFVGEVMYGDLTKAYLHPQAVEALAAAAAQLSILRPGYRLKITDAARPMSVQRRMYVKVRGTSKARYVSNPANGGGLHNFGLAVDITIENPDGNEIDMGTPVDHLGPEANINREAFLVKTGKISAAAAKNRVLLRRVMKAGGFMPLKSEWWHFNLKSRAEAKRRYKLLDF